MNEDGFTILDVESGVTAHNMSPLAGTETRTG